MRYLPHRGCVVPANNLEWNPARARPRDAAEDILRPEHKRQPPSPGPRYSNSAPNYGRFRVWWPSRSLVWPIFDGRCRLLYCAARAFLHSCPHRNLRCTLQHFNAERKFESARLSPNHVRQALASIGDSPLTIQIALQFSESPHARCPHARIRLHLPRLQQILRDGS